MSYNFHIERTPQQGWDLWTRENTPLSLSRQLDSCPDPSERASINEKIEDALQSAMKEQHLLISPEEWVMVVQRSEGTRFAEKDSITKNPRTGEPLVMKVEPHDVEVYDQASNRWRLGFRFSKGRAFFNGRAWEPGNEVAKLACSFAAALSANIVSEEGDLYPLEPGNHAR